jgi:hypothetical protein
MGISARSSVLGTNFDSRSRDDTWYTGVNLVDRFFPSLLDLTFRL